MVKRWIEQWRLYGLPRCAGWMTPVSDCHRLLWPWFTLGGDGEDAMCFDCTLALDAWRNLGEDRWASEAAA